MASEIHIPSRNSANGTNPEFGHGDNSAADTASIRLASDTFPDLSQGLGWAERIAKPGAGALNGEVHNMLHGFKLHQPAHEGNSYQHQPTNGDSQQPQFKS